jgi:hypothetical protein
VGPLSGVLVEGIGEVLGPNRKRENSPVQGNEGNQIVDGATSGGSLQRVWKKKARESPRLLKNPTFGESLRSEWDKESREDEGKHDPKIMEFVGAAKQSRQQP